MLDSAAKDLRRLRRIVGIVAKYGYGELIRSSSKVPGVDGRQETSPGNGELESLPEPSEPSLPATDSAPRRFRLMLEELGPTFIKFGQVLSARPDLVSKPYVDELKELQYQCLPLPYTDIKAGIRAGLGADPSTLFEWIDETPLATASVAQVHRARTRAGADVVVKVQRPGIREEIRSDIVILYRLARLLDKVIEESAIAEPIGVVKEFEKAIDAELNFQLEAANLREFRRLHQDRTDVVIPAVQEELSSETVLTLELLRGVPFTSLPPGTDKKKIAQRIVREAFDEVFIDGFFHADPHPGNLLLLEDGRYGILDFGVCGRLTPQMRETLVVLALAIALKDSDTAARTLYRLGQGDSRVSIAALRDDLDTLFSRYLGRKLEEVDSTAVLQELLNLALKHKIRVPAEYTMLGRAGATIEGLVREYDPELDIAAVAAPYAERLLLARVAPGEVQGSLYRMLLQFQGMSKDLPMQASQILNDLSAGNFYVNVRGAPIERLNETILIASTAVAGSIIAAAFIIGSFVALAGAGWKIFGIPVLAVLGLGFAFAVMSWLSAYVMFRPRMRKISIAGLLRGKKK